jgi:hypothetical protein
MLITMGQLGGLRQVPQKSLFGHRNRPRPAMVDHSLHFQFIVQGRSPPSSVQHAIHFRAFGLRIRSRRLGGIGRQPRVHHFQPGRRLWCRPVPRQGREMWRPRRFVLLPVAGFRRGDLLPARRSGRDYRLGSPGGQELHPFRLQRIRRHYLPALNCRPWRGRTPAPATLVPRKRRDAAPRSLYGKAPLAAPAVLLEPARNCPDGRTCLNR